MSQYQEQSENVTKGHDGLNLITDIQAYAESHPKFDAKFVNSVAEFLESKGFVTSGQYNGLLKVYTMFKMDKVEAKKEVVCSD